MVTLTAKVENYPLDAAEIESWEKVVEKLTVFDGYFAFEVDGRITTLEMVLPDDIEDHNLRTLVGQMYGAGAHHIEFSRPI